MYFCFILVGLFCALTQVYGAESKIQQQDNIPAYSKKIAGGIRSKSKKNIMWLTSVSQAMRGAPAFRYYCNHGKSNQIKKRCNELFKKLDAGSHVNSSATNRFVKFLDKQAIKSKSEFNGNIVKTAQFLLSKCGMPTFSYVQEMSIVDRNNRRKSISVSYPIDNARIITISCPGDDLCENLTIKDMLKDARYMYGYNKREIANLAVHIGRPLPTEAITKLSKNKKPNDYYLTLATHFKFQNEKTIPRLLPIYVQRWFNTKISHRKPKKVDYSYRSMSIRPSSILEIPLEKNPGKIARYKLVSMVVNQYPEFVDKHGKERRYSHAYACVLTRKRNKNLWAVYNDEGVFTIKHPHITKPKALKYLDRDDVSNLYKEVSCHGTLFFYQFAGLRVKENRVQ